MGGEQMPHCGLYCHVKVFTQDEFGILTNSLAEFGPLQKI